MPEKESDMARKWKIEKNKYIFFKKIAIFVKLTKIQTKQLGNMKKLSVIMGGLLLVAAAFQSCKQTDEIWQHPTEEDVNLHDPDVNVTYNGKAVIMGVTGENAGEIQQVLAEFIPNTQQTVDESTTLLIVPSLSEAYEEQLLAMYEQGGVIAIINPDRADLDNWYEKHKWVECKDANDMDGTLIYSFSPTHHCIVTEPDDDDIYLDEDDDDAGVMGDEDVFFDHLIDDIDSEDVIKDEDYSEETDENYEQTTSFVEDNYSDMYTNLHPWITILNEDLEDKKEMELMTRSGVDTPDVSKVFNAYPYGKTYPFSVNAKVRKWGVFKADRIKGNGSIGVSFDIYQIHCYDDQPGSGDYYLVDMTASVANSDLYKGKWWNNHAGTYIRICGLYAKSFEIQCTPVDGVTKQPLESDRVTFTANGFPSPATTVGETHYEKSSTFEIAGSASISKSKSSAIDLQGGKEKKGMEYGVELSMGASWTKSENRTVSDTDITNTTTGNQVGYKLIFNNLPKFSWSQSRGFDEGKSLTYRSTVDIRSSWIWHVKDAKDNSEEAPIAIRFRAKPVYEAMSFVTTKADLKTVTFDNLGNVEDYIELQPFTRKQCGKIILENDFKNNVSIKNTRLYHVDPENKAETLIWESKSTIKPGNKVATAPLHIVNDYTVRFTTTDDREYEYTSYDTIQLENSEEKVIYSATDFKLIK